MMVIRDVRKPKFDIKKSEPNLKYPKIWFSDRNCVQSTVQINSHKNNFTRIQSADKECFKTRLKRIDFRMQLHLLTSCHCCCEFT